MKTGIRYLLRLFLFLKVLTRKIHTDTHNTGLFISRRNISKIHNKYIAQRIMVVLTLIERETLQVFFFTYFTDAQYVHLW